MEKTTRITNRPDIEQNLQSLYKDYLEKRLFEYKLNKLTGRLVIDIQKGEINSLQDQAIIAGVSVLHIYDQKIIE